ncbi:hypothetical protein A8F94_02365 [Bacillus sp. FJAT-27225]|nr:hypothetical protein A8F94_02365 [Bacillus sp. FJAT-27225]
MILMFPYALSLNRYYFAQIKRAPASGQGPFFHKKDPYLLTGKGLANNMTVANKAGGKNLELTTLL